MNFLKHILNTAFAIAIIMIAFVKSNAQSANPDAVYYVCAEQGYRLNGPAGFDHYQWMENTVGMQGADSNNIQVQAMGASAVGNAAVTKTYHLKVMNNNSCWSEEATYVIHILPKLELTVMGYSPPYCEHLSHDITLTARINGGPGISALTLPSGVTVKYTWTVVAPNNFGPAALGNAGILGPDNEEQAQVMTPQDATIDNNYNVKVEYSYPATVNVNNDVVGSCGTDYTQNVHADPAPDIPTINYQPI